MEIMQKHIDEEPISPVSRDDTVTNRKPKSTIRIAPSRFMWSGLASTITVSSSRMPIPTTFIGRSFSVRSCAPLARAAPPPRSRNPSRKPCQMIGIERARLMMPPAATAPAPI